MDLAPLKAKLESGMLAFFAGTVRELVAEIERLRERVSHLEGRVVEANAEIHQLEWQIEANSPEALK